MGLNHKKRMSRFTSSQVHKLMKSGTKGSTFSASGKGYIREKLIEHRFQKSLNTNVYSQPIAWGHIMEVVAFEKMPMSHVLCSSDSKIHPSFDSWAGTPDMKVELNGRTELISEIKCYQMQKFADYTDCILEGDVSEIRRRFPQEYWQIVSNCEIFDCEFGEAVTFMPYKEDLIELRERIMETDFLERNEFDLWKMRFIAEKEIYELPHLKKEGYYKNLNRFMFEIPQVDRDFLRERISLATADLKQSIYNDENR